MRLILHPATALLVILLFASSTPAEGDERPTAKRSVLIGTDAGLWRATGSTEPKSKWTKKELMARPGQSVRCVLQDPRDGSLVVGFGMRGAGLFRSADDGETWAAVAEWPRARQAWSLQLFDDGRIWVGSEPAEVWQGSLKTGGWARNDSIKAIPMRDRWTFVRPPYHAHVLGFARDPKNKKHWAAAIEQGGVIESVDNGKTWIQISPLWDVHVVLFTSDGNLVAATGGGLYTRKENTWSKPLVAGYATGLCRGPKGTLHAALRGAAAVLWRSRDHGASWQRLPAKVGEPGHGVHALAADPELPEVVFHGAGRTLWYVDKAGPRIVARELPVIRRLHVAPVR